MGEGSLVGGKQSLSLVWSAGGNREGGGKGALSHTIHHQLTWNEAKNVGDQRASRTTARPFGILQHAVPHACCSGGNGFTCTTDLGLARRHYR